VPNDDKSTDNTKVKRFASFSPNRQVAAYLLMSLFVTCTTVGAFLIYLPAGFVTLGVTSGLYAYLLGSD
jgi:hypothetical protein